MQAIAKWIVGLLIDKGLRVLFEFLKKQIRLHKSKESNKEVVEEVEGAETEEDFKKAADRVAGHHRSDAD